MHGLEDERVSPTITRHLTAALLAAGGQVTAVYFPQADHAALVPAFSRRLPVLADVRAFIVADPAPRCTAYPPPAMSTS